MLEQILNEIEQLEKLANTDVESMAYTVQAGWATAKANAKKQLVEVKEKYINELLKVTDASSVEGTLKVDTQALYNTLAQPLEEMFVLTNNRRFASAELEILTNFMYQIGEQLGVTYFYPLQINSVMFLNTYDELKAYVKQLVRASVGDEFNKLYIRNYIKNEAIAQKVTKPTLILLLNASEPELSELGTLFRKFNSTPSVDSQTTKETPIFESKETEPKLKKINTKTTNK